MSWGGAGAPWRTTTAASDTSPNSVFAPDPYGTSDNALLSPVMLITTTSAQLSFRHSFSTYYYYDGGVLEISTNGGAFTDIITAGGTFVANGYYATLYTGYGNPLGGRPAWTGSSGGFLTSIVNLPATTAGQNVQLRWRFGSSSSYGGSGGWYIDTVSVTDGFDCCVPVPNDIAVGISDSPDPAVVGGTLTYTITVVNTGPSTANNVTVVEALPPGFTLQSLAVLPPVALSRHGTSGGTITLDIGSMSGGSSVNIIIGGTPNSVGFITNRVTVTRSEPDANLANNTATAVTAVLLPSLSINDVSLLEGNSGTTNAAFTVSLSAPAAQTVAVNYATSNQTALAGRDYVAASGTLAFAPGVTSRTILVPVIGNTLNEPDKTFLVTLSNPSNAGLARSQATGRILNDDPLPNLSVNDATVVQPDSGTADAVFTVSLSAPSGRSVYAYYFTSNGTATASSDYVPLYSTQLTFLPGETNKTVTVVVNDHTTVRPAQTFYVALESPYNGKIARGIGLGTIITAQPGRGDHFIWSAISSPQAVGGPFAVTITAQDYWNNTATNFTGSVGFSGWTNADTAAAGTIEDFESGTWPHAPWLTLSNTYGYVSPTYAHDGVYGLSDPEWTYRTDLQVGTGGDSLSWWVRPSYSSYGRAYLGFGASAGGAWSVVAAPNSGEFMIQRNPAYGYSAVATVSQTWQAGRWYKVVVQFLSTSSVTCNLYDSDGTTLLNSLSYNGVTGLPGGVAIRSFDQFFLDTIGTGDAGGTSGRVALAPTNSGSFSSGIWHGKIAVAQPATNVTLRADDGHGHTGSSHPFDVQPVAGQVTSFAWNPVSSPQTSGVPFGVTVIAQDFYRTTATNFNDTVAMSAAAARLITNTILPSPSYTYYSGGSYTYGYAFTPSTNMTVTHVRHYFGTKVSIWTDGGVLLASRSVSSVAGTWRETPLVSPVQLTAGTTYRVAVYTGGGNYYYRTDMAFTFPNGTINQSCYASGDAFPSYSDSVQWWFVDLKYTVLDPIPDPISVSPAISANFTNGVWRGSLTAERSGASVLVRADDGLGHTGSSNPFNVVPGRGQIDHLVWNPIASPQAVGEPFGVTVTAQDYYNTTATNFNGAVTLSGSWPGALSTNTILPSPSYQSYSSGYYTFGYAFTPNTTMTVTHVRHYFGTKVSIWTDTGVLLASQNVTSVPGTWVETALTTPIQLTAGTRYRVASYTGGGNYYYRTGMASTFPNGTINQGYYASGDAFPSSTDSAQWFFVDLKYTVGSPISVAVTPGVSGNFTNGVWSGSVSVTQQANNLVLRADDGIGHNGSSNPFNVAPRGQADHFAWSSIASPQSFGVPFAATITAQDGFNSTATNFNGTVALSASGSRPATNTILPSPSYEYYSSGSYTFGYAFTPNTSMTVTHVRHYFGTKVSIWTDAGVLLASRSVSSVAGTWRETALVSPVQLTAGTTYRVGVYTGGGNYYYRYDMAFTFPNGTINQSYEASGDAFPSYSDSYYWMFVDLKYTVATPVPLVVSPANSGNFTNGIWSGSVAVPASGQPVANVIVRADDGNGHSGSSNPFDMLPGRGRIDHLVWNPISSPQAVGEPFGVTVTAQDYYNGIATNFTGTVTLSGVGEGGVTTNTILSSPSYQSYSSGSYTLGYAFTPNTNMTVTHVRHYFGTKVSIWTDAGLLLASQNVTSVPGTWVETPLTTPIQLTAGTRYRVAAYTGGGNYYYRTDMVAAFPYGTIDQSYEASSDVFPSTIDSVRWWLVDLKYTAGSQVSVPIAPSVSSNFSNGIWSGSVTVPQGVTNLALQADDGIGHNGSSNPFNVAPRGQMDHFAWSSIASPQSFGVPFAATITAQDGFNSTATNFNGTVALSTSGSRPATNTILPSPSYEYYSSGSYTFGYAFTPNTSMTVTHVRHYFGTKVSIWTDAGVLLASRSVSSVAGTWRETALVSPVQLTAGTTYRVGVYTGGGNYYYRYDMAFTFPNGTINQSYEASGDAFPSYSDSYYWMFVDLKYTVATPVPLVVSPANSGNFTNGIWSGSVAVSASSQPVSNVVVRADDGNGHTGSSNPFHVVPGGGQIDHLVWSSIASPQTMGVPFGVTVTARDYYNGTATNFAGTATLSGSWPGGLSTNTILPSPSYQYLRQRLLLHLWLRLHSE